MMFEQCKDVKKLNPLVQIMLQLALTELNNQGVTPLIVETYRSQERQNYLYCQGRTLKECMSVGIPKSFALQYARKDVAKVTWTLHSVHSLKKAVDVIPVKMINGKKTAIWNAKDSDTKKIIRVMKQYGFEAGADWKRTPDSPHFQVCGSYANVFQQNSCNSYVTKRIQEILNQKIGAGLIVDGIWGAKTTKAVNEWRKSVGYRQIGCIGRKALINLFAG